MDSIRVETLVLFPSMAATLIDSYILTYEAKGCGKFELVGNIQMHSRCGFRTYV